jgi:hypothetical protein
LLDRVGEGGGAQAELGFRAGMGAAETAPLTRPITASEPRSVS